MKKDRICELCDEKLEEDDEGHYLKDGRLVCSGCFEFSCAPCDDCGELFEEDDLTGWGDDYRLCPECFKQYFPPYDYRKNLEETTEAYEAMCKRLIGKKTDHEEDDIHIETDMNDDSFKYEIDVSIDEEGRISDISRYSIYRCRYIGIKSEDWRDYPVKPSDYDENGPAEDLIRSEIEILDE